MTEILPLPAPEARPPAAPAASGEAAARAAAAELETVFLEEMLKAAGVGEQKNSFSGGVGERQFASFQRRALAGELVRQGGIGLAEQLFRALVEASHDT